MLGRHYLITAFGQILQSLLALASLFLLARILQPATFGVATILTVAVTLVAVATTAGMQAAILVMSGHEARRQGALHGLSVTVAIAVGGASLALAVAFEPRLAGAVSPGLAPLIIALGAARIGPTIYASLGTTQLIGSGRIQEMAVLNIVGGFSTLLGPIGAFLAPDPLGGAVVGAFMGNSIWAAAAFRMATHAYGIEIPREAKLWRDVARIALPLQIGTAAYWVMLRADAFILNASAGSATLGVYAIALSIADRVSVVTTPLYNATAWRVTARNLAGSLDTTLLVLRLEVLVGVVMALAAIIVGPTAIALLAGRAYIAASVPLAILLVGTALLPVWGSLGLFLVSQAGGAALTAAIQIFIAILAVLGYLIVIPTTGMIGAAVVSTTAYLLLVFFGLAAVRRNHSFPLRALVPQLADLRGIVTSFTEVVRQQSVRSSSDVRVADESSTDDEGS